MAWIGAGDIKPVINLKNIDTIYLIVVIFLYIEKLCLEFYFFGGICLTNSFQNVEMQPIAFFEGDAFVCWLMGST